MPSIHTKQNKDLPFGIFRNKRLLAPYHDVAASVFRNNKSANLDEIFLASARDGDYDRIQTLVRPHDQSSMNIDVKDRRYGNSAVIWAAKRGHIKILQLLLKHGADVTLRNYDNKTALDEASPGIQQILVATVTSGGSSPRRLMQAAWQGNSHAVEQILSERRVIDINCQNADGMTPLLLAACDLSLFEKIRSLLTNYDPVRVVSLLLQHRADPSACDSEGRTSLHHAALSKASAALNLIGLILGSGASIGIGHSSVVNVHIPIP
ncbi:PREDICTED: ankyrin repeat domain-containing protein 22-like [Priapulus caudatus]|uniref:Ankyrin repeat domain-containing protein 22-like n=1 Tax=Priapulus caudatus TaxID=37621 RepID=A0ABM1E8T9_PRICU|nr:PREDICTED: ankyrin repeat domain-containing protein 22-like [Priapulus caudatus]